jgi:hypothetical protein
MTTRTGSAAPPQGSDGKPQQAREEAREVGHQAAQAGSQVAQQAAGQGKQVVGETRQQARNLAGEASAQLRQQAETQQKRTAEGLRALGTELQSMASKSEQDGPASDVVRRASDAAQQAAGWLEQREPGELVNEVRDYARRHPGTFLAGAAVAGLLVGRLTRSLATAGGDGGPQGDGHRPGQGEQSAGRPSMPAAETPRSEPAAGGATTDVPTPGRR